MDDVFLVLRGSADTDGLTDGNQVMAYIADKIPRFVTAVLEAEPGLRVRFPYSGTSDLLFAGKKHRIFQLKGPSGLDLLGPIEEQLRQQSSEHRDMPDLPSNANRMAHRSLLVSSDGSELADALRKADSVSLRRAGFAMLLSDAEAYSRDLPPSEWETIRHTFFDLARRNLLTPKGLFDYSRYYSRVLALMVVNKDWFHAAKFMTRLQRVFETLHETCGLPVSHIQMTGMINRIGITLTETVLMVSRRGLTECVSILDKIGKICGTDWKRLSASHNVANAHARLCRIDWAHDAYWPSWADSVQAKAKPTPLWLVQTFSGVFQAVALYGECTGCFPSDYRPVLFPTRKIPMYNIIRNAPALLTAMSKLTIVLRGLRSQTLPKKACVAAFPTSIGICYHLPKRLESEQRRVRVAVSNLEVSDAEWECAAKGYPSLTLARYDRLNRLLDAVAEAPEPEKADYVILPECCLPRQWERSSVMRTLGRGVSLIAGLEYRIERSGIVHNEALVALKTTVHGFPFWLPLVQEKVKPAYREEALLKRYKKKWSLVRDVHPVYEHGGFIFGVLICSELTDIRYRLFFQGEVDALFVPEWNQDIETFSALVESAALDVHTYIVQANNRKYGDSRLRAPLAEAFRRDVVRTKGGVNDYFVVGELEYGKLRDFQNNTPAGDSKRIVKAHGANLCFKPVPQGFTMSDIRKQIKCL